MAADKLRDLSQPIDVKLLDAAFSALYGTGSEEERTAAVQILRELQNNPDTWLQVAHILQNTKNLNTKFFALRVLEGVIKCRWTALPVEQRDCLTRHISKVIVQLSSNEGSLQMERRYIDKLNIILVQILKHEWPGRWRSFIVDLVSDAKTSETICENCMAIFELLSEEVFDFLRGEMRQQKNEELKQLLISEFLFICELCLYALTTSQRTELIRATLSTLLAFLSWIPLGYTFESQLLEMLLKFFTMPSYMNLTLQCLTKVAAFSCGGSYNVQCVNMYKRVMAQLQAILPLTTDIPRLYALGSSEEQAFIQNLALFFASFYEVHMGKLESTWENIPSLLLGLEYLINISYVDDPGVFKVCLEYWYALVLVLFGGHNNLDDPTVTAKIRGLQMRPSPHIVAGLDSQMPWRWWLYACPMLKLTVLIFYVMAKLEGVFTVECKNGNIVGKTVKDNDDLIQYEMLKSLFKQLCGEDWSWTKLSILYWAVGSTSESMTEEQGTAAYHILRELQHYPVTRLQVVHVLQNTKNSYTTFSALQVFKGVIKYRWNALPIDQRDQLKNYISKDIVQLSSDEASLRMEKPYIHKLNIILVQILKHEWPGRCRNFIPELVSAAKTSETFCENCMAILKLLSEEVLDFSRGEMREKDIMELKQLLNSDFQCIHGLCLYVLSTSQRTELIRATLSTLHAFLSWIPLGCIFETLLLEELLKLLPLPSYLNLTVQCLTKVAALNYGDSYNVQYGNMYNIFMVQLQAKLPPTNIPLFYAEGSSEDKAFIQNLALFLTTFYKFHIRILESTPDMTSLLLGLEYLINISYVKDCVVFKVCLEFWHTLVLELFEAHDNLANPAAMANMMGLQMRLSPGIVDGLAFQVLQRRQLYAGPMLKLIILISYRMSWPEEFFTVEDENGSIACKTMKCEDVLIQYKIMTKTWILLSLLDYEGTGKQMLMKLWEQLSGEDCSRNNLNTSCCTSGSTSESVMEE